MRFDQRWDLKSYSSVYANEIGLGSGLKKGIGFWVSSEIGKRKSHILVWIRVRVSRSGLHTPAHPNLREVPPRDVNIKRTIYT